MTSIQGRFRLLKLKGGKVGKMWRRRSSLRVKKTSVDPKPMIPYPPSSQGDLKTSPIGLGTFSFAPAGPPKDDGSAKVSIFTPKSPPKESKDDGSTLFCRKTIFERPWQIVSTKAASPAMEPSPSISDHQILCGLPDYLKFVHIASYLDLPSLVSFDTAMCSRRVNDNGSLGLRDSMLSLFKSHSQFLKGISSYMHRSWNSIFWCYVKQIRLSSIKVSPLFNVHDTTNEKGGTLLHAAYQLLKDKKISQDFFTYVVKSGDVNQQKIDGSTLLMTAVKDYNLEVCELLIECGANMNVMNKMGKNALQMALTANSGPTSPTNATTTTTTAPRSYTFATDDAATVSNDVSMDEKKETSPMMRTEMVSFLIAKGCDVSCKSKRGDSTLHLACIDLSNDGDTELISLLISNGADVTSSNRLGATSLHVAAASGKLEICKLLVRAGASFSQVNNRDCSPFDVAMIRGHSHIVEFFRNSRNTQP